jgi:hypothetical protein
VVLSDAFGELLATAKQLVTDPAVKQAIADDLDLLEQKAGQGIDALEQHVATWFAAHYALPAPAQTAPAQPTEPAPAQPVQVPPAMAADGTAAGDAGTAVPAAPADGDAAF